MRINNDNLFIYIARSVDIIANNSNDLKQINISNEHDFLVDEIRTTGTNNIRILIQSSDEKWSNEPLNMGLVGAGFNGKKLYDKQFVISAGTQLDVNFENKTGGATSSPVELQIWGYKIPKM